MQKKKFKRN